jgi:hypothetical protein
LNISDKVSFIKFLLRLYAPFWLFFLV